MDDEHRFDAADYIRTAEDVDALLRTALEDASDDPSAVAAADGIVERSGRQVPSWWKDSR
ncbi:hypothetical protein [Brachybacterium sp. NPDC056505]|uniref:hypothetical protein n=1 Tax=Brachybacterium sp. NPDC056505 TaxID=3345843 RepID=UPI00366A8B58